MSHVYVGNLFFVFVPWPDISQKSRTQGMEWMRIVDWDKHGVSRTVEVYGICIIYAAAMMARGKYHWL